MAKAKAKKQTVTVASAVQACVAKLVPVFMAQNTLTDANAKAAASRSATIVSAIDGLHTAYPLATDYADACVEVFGNGVRGKENKAGRIADELKAAKVTALTVKSELARARTVAFNWGNADVRKAATETGLRKAYDTAKPKAAPEAKDAGAGTVTTVSPAMRQMQLIEECGISGVFGMIESYFTTLKDPIRATVVRDARNKIAA